MEDQRLLVSVKRVTTRLRYTFDLIFKDILGIEYSFETDKDLFIQSKQPKITYDVHPIGDELFFYSAGILFEKGIEDQNLAVIDWAGTKGLFATHPKYVIPFDPFAASFYMISRYEEYLPHHRDIHNRYDATESIAFKKDFLHQPVIDIYAHAIRDLITSRYPHFIFPERKYKFTSTIDIDNAWAYLEKGILRTIGAFGKSLINLDTEEAVERLKVLLKMKADPYDTYDFQLELQKELKFKVIYFFLLGEYGTNDRNVPVDSRKLHSLIKSLADYADTGIHPSYGSNSNPERLRKELRILNQILKREVHNSRQHFLVLRIPETYRNLIDLDITDDYTMGYAIRPGFRAGTCTPFKFYDLDNEVKTNLTIHPFAVMDATLKFYMKLEPSEAMSIIGPLISEVKKVSGNFISLWHNESLSENKIWNGWKAVYEQLVREAVE